MPAKKPEWEGAWVVIKKGEGGEMTLEKRQSPAHQWAYPTSMEYAYPDLEFDHRAHVRKGAGVEQPQGRPPG